MIKIPEIIEGKGEVKGVTFSLIERTGLHSIWSRSDGYFEYVKLIEQKESKVIFNDVEVVFEEKEVYPQGESWGINGQGKCSSSLAKIKEIYYSNIKNDENEK